ncbi:MAG TPA: APC family permease, partial [Gemmatimonadaceae bacterium]|nr:APC family permease [Gemmatimonadaceae bacterium]
MAHAGTLPPLTMTHPTLARRLTLTGLVATGVCSMIGVAINTIPFSMQRTIPGLGPNVLLAFILAAIPALLCGLAFAALASAMPNAGGTYVYASRALSPYLGFVASFSQWLAICVAMGIVSYLVMPFLRDLSLALDARGAAALLDAPVVRIAGPLALIWTAAIVNIRGVREYQRTVVPLMYLMLAIGAVVIVAGFSYTHAEFEAAVRARDGITVRDATAAPLPLPALLAAVPVIFSCFIGFDSIAQAGGEAADPTRTLPLAILISVVGVAAFYLLFTAAVYHAVPWSYVAEKAMTSDVTAPGLLGFLLPRTWG